MKRKEIDFKDYKGLYYIYEDGSVYSCRKKKMLKPLIKKPYNYVSYYLTGYNESKWFYAHRLSAHHFIGKCPSGKEVHHKDHNKMNNHYSNLEYVSHSTNILESFQSGDRKSYWLGKTRPTPSLSTKMKMSTAKFKPILSINIDTKEKIKFESIGHLIEYYGLYRKKFNRIMDKGGVYKNLIFHFVQ